MRVRSSTVGPRSLSVNSKSLYKNKQNFCDEITSLNFFDLVMAFSCNNINMDCTKQAELIDTRSFLPLIGGINRGWSNGNFNRFTQNHAKTRYIGVVNTFRGKETSPPG